MLDRPPGLVDDAGRGPAIVTVAGNSFHIADPLPSEIHIEDIAHALSMTCRFTGHCNVFYSVAQHSVNVSFLMESHAMEANLGEPTERLYGLWGLIHDAPEAYLGDVSRPLKVLLRERGVSLYDELEEELLSVIAIRLQVPWPPPREAIKYADNVALATERRDLMPLCKEEWAGLPEPDQISIKSWPPEVAKDAFIRRFMQVRLDA